MYLLAGIIVANAIFFFYSGYEAWRQEAVTTRHAAVKPWVDRLVSEAMEADRAAHQFMISRAGSSRDQYMTAVKSLERNFDSLKYNLKKYSIEEAMIQRVQAAAGNFLEQHRQFREAVQDDGDQLIAVFNQLSSSDFSPLTLIRSTSEITGVLSGKAAFVTSRASWILQTLLLAGAFLILLLAIRFKRHHAKLVTMNREIEESNRKYVFDPLDEVDYENEVVIKTRLLSNLKKAAEFIQQVANGNYSITWEGMNDMNREVNRENIAGELIRMREQMKQVKEQDERRLWATEGLSQFGEIIRKNQDNMEALSDTVISTLVKYVKARAGGLFIMEESDGLQFLELKACYAFERKKFINKRIEIGEGIVGQTFLEGQTIYLKEVPDAYLSITSGLGETTPRSLLVIPLKVNERVEGVMELASLNEFMPHEIEFLEKLAETFASSVISVRTSERTKSLLEISQQQSEEMRAQEEEMRQNMEELAATQEQMQRQVDDLNKMRETLEAEKFLFNAFMDNMPDTIYFKDVNSRFTKVSKYMAQQLGKMEYEVAGKTDFDFDTEERARERVESDKQIMITRKPRIDFIEREIRDGGEYWMSSTKIPLINAQGEVVGTFGVSRDVTRLKQLELDVAQKEDQLRESEMRYEQRVKQMKDAIAEAEMELERLRKEKM